MARWLPIAVLVATLFAVAPAPAAPVGCGGALQTPGQASCTFDVPLPAHAQYTFGFVTHGTSETTTSRLDVLDPAGRVVYTTGDTTDDGNLSTGWQPDEYLDLPSGMYTCRFRSGAPRAAYGCSIL